MQTIRWIAFGLANATTRTALHFYPSAGNVTAPYPVSCKLSVFGEGIEKASISVDGLRLSQPEGIWVDEAFPVLKSGALTLFGLEIVLSCSQHRVELDGSSCIVELNSLAQSVRYWPVSVEGGSGRSRALAAAALRDAFSQTALVAINSTPERQEFAVALSAFESSEPRTLSSAQAPALPPHALAEIPLDLVFDENFAALKVREYSWGVLRARNLALLDSHSPLVAYALHRDSSSRRILSVCGL